MVRPPSTTAFDDRNCGRRSLSEGATVEHVEITREGGLSPID